MAAPPGAGASRAGASPAEDPRWIVTPDAFSVDPTLLGRPLGQHPRRLAAILLDLLLVALLTQLPGFLLAILAAYFFFRMAGKKRPNEPSSAMRSLFRGTVGCFGAVVALVAVLLTWNAISGLIRGSANDDSPRSAIRADLGGLTQTLSSMAMGWGEFASYRASTTPEEAEARGRALASRMMTLEAVGEAEVRELLLEMAPEGASWRDDIEGWDLGLIVAPDQAEAPDPSPEPEGEVATALEDADTPITPREQAALDSLQALQAQIARERAARQAAQGALSSAQAELEAAQGQGFIMRFLRRAAEDLGLGLGWAALYFSVFSTLWKGQTPGKRVMRLRVVRLDGKPMTWWTSFERYGGYAAGFATGLLGFAQVFWDPNRQAIHDKISGTAVLQDGKPPVPGLWSASAGPRPAILDRPPQPKEHV